MINLYDLNDEDFIAGFEAGTLPADLFHHDQHIRIVWLYLHRCSMLETLRKFSENLKRFATANGKPNLYHETITWAYVFLIHERMTRNGPQRSWEDFASENADLFDWENSILKTYYSDETLRSERARRSFVFPDRVGQVKD